LTTESEGKKRVHGKKKKRHGRHDTILEAKGGRRRRKKKGEKMAFSRRAVQRQGEKKESATEKIAVTETVSFMGEKKNDVPTCSGPGGGGSLKKRKEEKKTAAGRLPYHGWRKKEKNRGFVP